MMLMNGLNGTSKDFVTCVGQSYLINESDDIYSAIKI